MELGLGWVWVWGWGWAGSGSGAGSGLGLELETGLGSVEGHLAGMHKVLSSSPSRRHHPKSGDRLSGQDTKPAEREFLSGDIQVAFDKGRESTGK